MDGDGGLLLGALITGIDGGLDEGERERDRARDRGRCGAGGASSRHKSILTSRRDICEAEGSDFEGV